MKTFRILVAIELLIGVLTLGSGTAFAATVYTTNATDTIGTFRTNVNSSLTNLNSQFTGTSTGVAFYNTGLTSSANLVFNSVSNLLQVLGTASSSQLYSPSSTLAKLTFTNASGTNLTISGTIAAPSFSYTNASGTNATLSGYVSADTGTFNLLGFANATGTGNLQVNTFKVTGQLNASSSVNIEGVLDSRAGLLFVNATGTGNLSAGSLSITGVASSSELRSPSSTIAVLRDSQGNKYATSTAAGLASGTSTNIQFNESGVFGADPTFNYTSSSRRMFMSGSTSSLVIGTTFAATNGTASTTVASSSGISTYTVPANVYGLTLTVIGAGGGTGTSGAAGGKGEIATGTIAVAPNETLYVYAPPMPTSTSAISSVGGCSGGGGGTANGSSNHGGAGGPCAWVSRSSTFGTSTALMIAGGGGGGGGSGGAGSGGDAGVSASGAGGGAGTATAGGAGAANNATGNAGTGTAGTGGLGGTPTVSGGGGGGGGGGFFGGGGGGGGAGGSNSGAGGGGGTDAYFSGGITRKATSTNATVTDGKVVIQTLSLTPFVTTSTAALNLGGPIILGGGLPTVSAGTLASWSSDTNGRIINPGSTTVTLTLSYTPVNPPDGCVFTASTSSAAFATSTANSVTITTPQALSNGWITYICPIH